jgi:hypothetical protein
MVKFVDYQPWTLKASKAGSVNESFGRRLQKASGLSGYQARNWQL